MSFKEFLGRVHEMEFLRTDAFGGHRLSMGHLRLWSDDRDSGIINFIFDKIDRDCILEGLRGKGEYFQGGPFGRYIHLYGNNEREMVVFDAILTDLHIKGQRGLHLHGRYGFRDTPISPLTLNDIPREPINVHDLAETLEGAANSDVRSKKGDIGSTVVGSSWTG